MLEFGNVALCFSFMVNIYWLCGSGGHVISQRFFREIKRKVIRLSTNVYHNIVNCTDNQYTLLWNVIPRNPKAWEKYFVVQEM